MTHMMSHNAFVKGIYKTEVTCFLLEARDWIRFYLQAVKHISAKTGYKFYQNDLAVALIFNDFQCSSVD